MSVSHSVDLPIPLRPMIATDSTPIENDTFSRTCDAPYPAAQVRRTSQQRRRCHRLDRDDRQLPAIPR